MAYEHEFFKESLLQFLPKLGFEYDPKKPHLVTLKFHIVSSAGVLRAERTIERPERPDDLTKAIGTLGSMQLELARKIVEEADKRKK